jgi:hypothetical protein
MLRAVTLLAGLAFATSLAAQTPDPAPSVTDTPRAHPSSSHERLDPQEIVCRNLRTQAGTRIERRRTERVCLTRWEWEQRTLDAQESRRALEDSSRNRMPEH